MEQNAWWSTWDLSYLSDPFGPVYGGHSIQEAAYQTLEYWMPTYIEAVNRQIGTDALKVPFEYHHRPSERPLSGDVRAAIMATVPTTVGSPEKTAAGYRANWRLDVMVFLYGTKDWQETEALTQAYAAVVRAILVQNPSLCGLSQATYWEGEEYLEGERSAGRVTGVAHVRFLVATGLVVNPFRGPSAPTLVSPGPDPTVETVTPTLEVIT